MIKWKESLCLNVFFFFKEIITICFQGNNNNPYTKNGSYLLSDKSKR